MGTGKRIPKHINTNMLLSLVASLCLHGYKIAATNQRTISFRRGTEIVQITKSGGEVITNLRCPQTVKICDSIFPHTMKTVCEDKYLGVNRVVTYRDPLYKQEHEK
jgi:hypothetical protein